MKHSMKLTLASLLALSIVAAGCGSSSNDSKESSSDTQGTSTDTASTDTSTAKEEPITITFAGSTWDTPSKDGNDVQKYLEEKYNVKIVNLRVTDDNFKVKIAGGEIPDIFPQTPNEADMTNFARQGIIASISVDDIRKYMPKYSADVDSVNPQAWDIALIDGKNYGVPRVWLNGAYGFIPTYNKNWLTKIGYSEAPKTIEEFEDVLTKFRNNDPDGNGKKDTYGMTARGKDARPQYFNSIFASFGVAPYQFKVNADGTLTWGAITDEAKAGLKLLNKWYKADLIDLEFLTDDNGTIGQKWNSQKIGYKENFMYHHLFGMIEGDKANGIEAAYGKGLIGAAGKPLVFSNGALQVPLLFGKDVETNEKKRIKILQILEDLATNDEVYLKTVFGEEGKTYDVVNGAPTTKAPYDTPEKKNEYGFGGFYNPLVERDVTTWKFHFTPDKLAFRDQLNSGNEIIADVLGPTVLDAKGKYGATLNALQDEFYTKAVTTKDDLDKLFEDFKNKWLKSGGQEMIDEATKVYQERQAAK
jgi:putative aldouronate transport system substrate-binding protein